MTTNEFLLYKEAQRQHSHHGVGFAAHRRRAMGFKPHDYSPLQRMSFKRSMRRQTRKQKLTGYTGGY